jgi:hypothetical protein
VEATPDDKAPSHGTDPERQIMRTTNKGWEYGGHAQARVDGAGQIMGACDVTDASQDQPQATPRAQATLANLAQAGMERPKDEGGILQAIPATWENGSDSEAAVEARET